MSAGLLERRLEPVADHALSPVPEPRPRARVPGTALPGPVVVYGDFECPWSYLAFRRAALLSAAGLGIDWRAIAREPRTRTGGDPGRSELEALQREMDLVLAALLPGESLPYDLAGFVPRTDATVAAYAESYAAGVAAASRRVIFESFWMHGVDIGDPRVLRTLLADALRGSASPSETVREWGLAVDVTGGPISTTAWRLTRRWAGEWHRSAAGITPVALVPGRRPLLGLDAVGWLGDQVCKVGVTSDVPTGTSDEPRSTELPALGWITEQGGRWLPRCQAAAAATRAAAG